MFIHFSMIIIINNYNYYRERKREKRSNSLDNNS